MPDDNVIDAWWFAASDRLPHSDGRPIVLGKTHSLDGKIVLCKHAMHASRHPLDALAYAPGPYLYRVRLWGDVAEEGDKLGARNREYLAMRDVTEPLRTFARDETSRVLPLWRAPQDHLATDDETLRVIISSRVARATWATAIAARGAEAIWVAAKTGVTDSDAEVAARDAQRDRFLTIINKAFI